MHGSLLKYGVEVMIWVSVREALRLASVFLAFCIFYSPMLGDGSEHV